MTPRCSGDSTRQGSLYRPPIERPSHASKNPIDAFTSRENYPLILLTNLEVFPPQQRVHLTPNSMKRHSSRLPVFPTNSIRLGMS
jgi:hypothetical protein